MSDGFFSGYWKKARANVDEAKKSGHIRIWGVGRRLHVVVEDHPDFVVGAKELAGRYRPKSGVWTFDVRSERLVRELCIKVYGVDSGFYDYDTRHAGSKIPEN